jgi:hypothetical protein
MSRVKGRNIIWGVMLMDDFVFGLEFEGENGNENEGEDCFGSNE